MLDSLSNNAIQGQHEGHDQWLVIIEDVPAWVCNKCGERYHHTRVYKRMRQIAANRDQLTEHVTIPVAKREILEKKSMAHLLTAVSHLVLLPKKHMWLDYDEEADALYVHFEKRPGSTHSEMSDDGVILDYKGRRLVGVTILDASQR